MIANSKDYYSKLSLPSLPPVSKHATSYHLQKYQETDTEQHLRNIINHISSRSNREKLKDAFNKVILAWTEKHDSLIQSVEDLEKTKKRLQCRLNIQSQYFDRSLKETQAFYERSKSNKRRSLLISSNTSGTSSSTRSSSRNSYVDDIMDPIVLADKDVHTYHSVFVEPEFISPNPIPSPLSTTNSSKDTLVLNNNETFWNTIVNGKFNKLAVDNLISDYLRQGGNPNIASTVKNINEGYGLIHALIAIKNTVALQKVIDAGAKVNVYPLTSKRENNMTPLVLAAKLGYTNGVRLLLERGGADLMNARGPYGENALHAAVQSESDELVGYLLRLCKNKLLEKADDNGATPLHYACITGRTRLITLFIRDCQVPSDPRDNKGETPLHYAVRNRNLKVVARLVGELGVDPNPHLLNQVPTPLDLAKTVGLKTITEYLKRVGAKTTKQLMENASIKHALASF